MPRPKVLIFDVNETLLDLAPVKASVAKALGGQEELVPLWFSTLLHYSLVETLTGHYHTFGDIGVAALRMIAESRDIPLSKEDAKAAVAVLRELPPHDDVPAALKALQESGLRLVSLTNSAAADAEAQLRNAKLAAFFEKRFSVEGVQKFKPHPDPYRMVLEDLGIEAGQAMMVAAHPWDLAGARSVGLQTAFVARPGKSHYPNVPEPDIVVKDLSDLVSSLRRE